MLYNYFKIAFRSLFRRKVHTSINLIGLTIGLTCFIIIFIWIRDELSYDKSLINKDRLFQLTIQHPSGIVDPNVPFILPILMADEFPEINQFSRIVRISNLQTCTFKYVDDKNKAIIFNEKHVCQVDPSFVTMFNYPLIYGDPEDALKKPNSILIREEQAIKYFGNSNPVGKILTLNFEL